MRVVIAYCYPSLNRNTYDPMARRFVQTYQDHPPGVLPHEIHVLVNGQVHAGIEKLFSPLPVQLLQHDNSGKDVGAYQMAAARIPCDLMVCLGSPLHFHKDGWLDRIIRVYEDNGPGLYGAWGFRQPKPHIRTTAFWITPELLQSYPHPVANHDRYEFEHGRNSITAWVGHLGFPRLVVTWDGVYHQPEWDHVTRDQSLFLDQHAERHNLK